MPLTKEILTTVTVFHSTLSLTFQPETVRWENTTVSVCLVTGHGNTDGSHHHLSWPDGPRSPGRNLLSNKFKMTGMIFELGSESSVSQAQLESGLQDLEDRRRLKFSLFKIRVVKVVIVFNHF